MKTISTTNAPAAIGPYAQGNITGGLLFASGQIPLDPETGELVLVDTSDRRVRDSFATAAAEEEDDLMKFFNRSGIDHISISTDRPYVNEVRTLFKRRARKR